MRQHEVRLVQNAVAVDEKIEIDDPRAPLLGGRTTHAPLDVLAAAEQIARGELRFHRNAGVDEPILIELAPGVRGKVARAGDEADVAWLRQELDCPIDIAGLVAEVRSQR